MTQKVAQEKGAQEKGAHSSMKRGKNGHNFFNKRVKDAPKGGLRKQQ